MTFIGLKTKLGVFMTKENFPIVLAVVVTLGFFGLVYLAFFHDITVSSSGLVDGLIGSLGTAWVGIINYYFGSSSGSAEKTKVLAEQMKK